MKQQFIEILKKSRIVLLCHDTCVSAINRHKMRLKTNQFWGWTNEDAERFNFYSQFIKAGDLVFDVGANIGNRSKIFYRLGAVVFAVEPQTYCTDFLKSAFHGLPNFHLVKKALGASVGQAEMMISDARTISSLSSEWIRAVKESGRFENYKWDQKETVLVDTLDNLISQYGSPAFIKIDVEGFEEQVLSGLSTPVRALSFEFTPEFIESTFRCIDHLCCIGDVMFQVSLEETMQFAFPQWLNSDEIKKKLPGLAGFGDIYASFKI